MGCLQALLHVHTALMARENAELLSDCPRLPSSDPFPLMFPWPEKVTWQHVTSRWFGRYYPTICLERKWNICKQHLVAIRTVKHLHQTDYSPHFTSVQHAHTIVCSLHSSTWLTSMGAFLNIRFLMSLPSFFGPDLCSVRWKRLHLWEEENVKGRYGVMWKWLYCFLWLNWKHFKQQFILGLSR